MVEVVIDEKGSPVEVTAKDPHDVDLQGNDVKEKAEKDVRKWKFTPLIYDGAAKRMKGIVWYPYFIKGSKQPSP